MEFGTSYTKGAEVKPCAICKAGVNPADKIVVERETIHNQCFKCGFCDAALKQGSCAMTRSPYGLHWYCAGPATKQCALKGTAEKEEKLKAKGAKVVSKK